MDADARTVSTVMIHFVVVLRALYVRVDTVITRIGMNEVFCALYHLL